MPFLRMPQDDSLAETLGRLGDALGNSLNPLNSLRAYDIQQQLFLRRQQLEQMQRENAAKQAAIQQWGHIVPPEKLPQIAAMIYQGAPYDQVARAAAQLTRVAQPEIAAVSTMTGTADLPPGVLDNILANVDNGVDYTLKRRELAGRVLGYGAPLNYPDFQQQDTSLLNDYQANADQRRQGYGAIGTGGAANNNPPPPVASQPTATWPDAITSLVHWLSSGGAQPSQPSPSPPPPDVASPSPSLSPPPGSSIWDTVSHFFGGGAQPQPAPSIELKPDANGAYPSTGGR